MSYIEVEQVSPTDWTANGGLQLPAFATSYNPVGIDPNAVVPIGGRRPGRAHIIIRNLTANSALLYPSRTAVSGGTIGITLDGNGGVIDLETEGEVWAVSRYGCTVDVLETYNIPGGGRKGSPPNLPDVSGIRPQ